MSNVTEIGTSVNPPFRAINRWDGPGSFLASEQHGDSLRLCPIAGNRRTHHDSRSRESSARLDAENRFDHDAAFGHRTMGPGIDVLSSRSVAKCRKAATAGAVTRKCRNLSQWPELSQASQLVAVAIGCPCASVAVSQVATIVF